MEKLKRNKIKREEGGCYTKKEHVKAWGDEIMIRIVTTL